MKIKRLLYALLVSCAMTFAPVWLLDLRSDSGAAGFLKLVGAFVSVPGAVVGWIAAGGKIDAINDLNFVIVDIANYIFYSGLAYLLLAVWGKHKGKTQQDKSIRG